MPPNSSGDVDPQNLRLGTNEPPAVNARLRFYKITQVTIFLRIYIRDIRPQTVFRQFLTVQFILGSRPKRAGNNTMNTKNEGKAKKKVTAMEVQKMYLLKHTYPFSFLLPLL